jgi:uncharacterized protein (DUF1501 family)
MESPHQRILRTTRRQFFGRTARGIGSLALASVMNPGLLRAAAAASAGQRWNGVMNPPPLPPKARRVIYLTMAGGPSHLETFDNKPTLAKMDGQAIPASLTDGQPIAQLQGAKVLRCLGPQHAFGRFGEAQQEISDILPHISGIADELCIIRSMVTEQINHDPAQTLMNTGTSISGRPSIGSWLNYGLGSENENLPGFVVLTSEGGGQGQPISARQWASGFLPSKFQGVLFRSKGDPVMYLNSPTGVSGRQQRDVIDAVEQINRLEDAAVQDPEISTRISQYEMAFKMQTSVPDLMDLSQESKETLELYGTKGSDGSFAANCLLARRLAERDVRFVQLYHRDWDHHSDLPNELKRQCDQTDRPAAALVKDLKRLGLLDETLVIWGGEFGRTPTVELNGEGKSQLGRDHNHYGFSVWMAGGGIKGGTVHGATDDFGFKAVQDPVSVHDLHATILHLLGFDHERLTYRYAGRDFRLTDVHGKVVKSIVA